METPKKLKPFSLLLLLFAALAALESHIVKRGLPGGMAIGLFEVALESLALYYLWYNRKEHRVFAVQFLTAFVSCTLIADFSYIIEFYLLGMSSQTLLAFLTTDLLYAVSFLSVSMMLWGNVSKNRDKYSAVLELGALFMSAPICLKFILFPYLAGLRQSGWSLGLIGDGLSILPLCALLSLSIVALIRATRISDAVFSSGCISLVLGDWAIRVDTILGSNPQFGVYEFLWGFGVLQVMFAILITPKNRFGLIELQPSLSQNAIIRSAIFAVGALSVVIVALQVSSDHHQVRVMASGLAVSVLLVALIGVFTLEQSKLAFEYMRSRIEGESTNGSHHSGAKEIEDQIARVSDELLDLHRYIKIEREKLGRDASRVETVDRVAHDLRSPLAALGVAIRDNQSLGPEEIELIRQAANRVKKISEDVLGERRSESIRINEISLDDVRSSMMTLIHQKKIEVSERYNNEISIEIDLSPLSGKVICKLIDLDSIVSNLINNCAEAMNSNMGKIQITWIDENSEICILIKDNGPGIRREVMSQLFERGRTFNKAEGNGLGLYNGKKAMEAMGGKLSLTSTEGVGTSAYIRLKRVSK